MQGLCLGALCRNEKNLYRMNMLLLEIRKIPSIASVNLSIYKSLLMSLIIKVATTSDFFILFFSIFFVVVTK